jgi:hypothetical protein
MRVEVTVLRVQTILANAAGVALEEMAALSGCKP